ncbi:MAG: MFS transporter, partial [Eggerthellaceae bacterium]|nr:MFS transporter [Eggerthellaceae bacterium]
LGIVIPLSAFLSRRASARQLFFAALGFFIAGSLLLIPVQSFTLLLLGRILQGIAAGILYPLMQVVVFSQFPLERRGTIMGFVGLTFGFAPNIGPTIAGAFTTALGWRSVFVFLLAFALVIAIFGFFLIKPTPAEAGQRGLDIPSVLLSSFGFGGLLMAFTNASDYGLASAAFLVALSVGAICLALFCLRQFHTDKPLMDLCAFKTKEFAAGTIILCLLFCANIGTALVIPLELQAVHGFSALEAGMALLPGTLTAVVVNPASGMIMDRTGARHVTCVCACALVVGSLAMVNLGNITSIPAIMFWQLVRQIGISGVIMPVNTWSLNALPRVLMPDGNSLTNTLRQVSAALGTAVMVLLMAGGQAGGAVSAGGVNTAMAFGLGCVFILAVLCFIYVRDN